MHGGAADVDEGMPRWVKVFVVVAVVVVLLVGGVVLFGGGEHGPGRHVPSQPERMEAADARPPAPGEREARGTAGTGPAPW